MYDFPLISIFLKYFGHNEHCQGCHKMYIIVFLSDPGSQIIVQLGPRSSKVLVLRFGTKMNTQVAFNTYHPPPPHKTF